ncbi:uncharacterized protein LOC119040399 [Artibeus jamaicensis]|uniref:uncharacterized protein LOC119040399 n=1 Tax=Artibeus jamaicensis TaxID=9417 RepID=UPI00235A5A3A|nr:uncharacterized protein LOC119040399 [Artibeus jamaicensis]
MGLPLLLPPSLLPVPWNWTGPQPPHSRGRVALGRCRTAGGLPGGGLCSFPGPLRQKIPATFTLFSSGKGKLPGSFLQSGGALVNDKPPGVCTLLQPRSPLGVWEAEAQSYGPGPQGKIQGDGKSNVPTTTVTGAGSGWDSSMAGTEVPGLCHWAGGRYLSHLHVHLSLDSLPWQPPGPSEPSCSSGSLWTDPREHLHRLQALPWQGAGEGPPCPLRKTSPSPAKFRSSETSPLT